LAGLYWFRHERAVADHEILSQRHPGPQRWPAGNHSDNEANMPFLFWMPMIVMCGLWRAAEEDAKTLFPSDQ
jgi:hypothetical protein